MEDTYLPAMRCPAYIGGMTLIRAFVWNLRTGSVIQREKVQVEIPRGRKYRRIDWLLLTVANEPEIEVLGVYRLVHFRNSRPPTPSSHRAVAGASRCARRT